MSSLTEQLREILDFPIVPIHDKEMNELPREKLAGRILTLQCNFAVFGVRPHEDISRERLNARYTTLLRKFKDNSFLREGECTGLMKDVIKKIQLAYEHVNRILDRVNGVGV